MLDRLWRADKLAVVCTFKARRGLPPCRTIILTAQPVHELKKNFALQ
jgi:hypothetical protein